MSHDEPRVDRTHQGVVEVEDSAAAGEPRLSILDLLNALLRHSTLLILLPLLLGLGFGLSRFLQPRSYEATVSFLPQSEFSGRSSMASLASQFGLDLPTAQPGQSPQFYVELLRSRTLLDSAVTSRYTFSSNGERFDGTLLELYQVESDDVRERLRKGSERLRKALAVEVSPRTGVVTMQVTTASPDLSEQVAGRLLELLGSFNMQTRSSRAANEADFVGERRREAEERLREAEERLQAFLGSNRQFQNSPDLLFEHDRLQRQVETHQQLYSSLVQSHEVARIEAVRNTPVLTVIEESENAARPIGRGTVLWGTLGVMVGGVLAVVVAILLDVFGTLRQTDRPDVQEFNRLRRHWRNKFWLRLPPRRQHARDAGED